MPDLLVVADRTLFPARRGAGPDPAAWLAVAADESGTRGQPAGGRARYQRLRRRGVQSLESLGAPGQGGRGRAAAHGLERRDPARGRADPSADPATVLGARRAALPRGVDVRRG